MGRIFVTGDKHGRYEQLSAFASKMDITTEDVVIILGDHGTLYFDDGEDRHKKIMLSMIPATFIMLHGNHDRRPESPVYHHQLRHIDCPAYSGDFYIDPAYPRLLYTREFGWYRFGRYQTFVIGGAYSVDKFKRLAMQARGYVEYLWFEDEQLSSQERVDATKQLLCDAPEKYIIISHTCPARFKPLDAFIAGVDQSLVDDTMEKWLDVVFDRVHPDTWYCGHWHVNREVNVMHFLFEDVVLLDDAYETETEEEV